MKKRRFWSGNGIVEPDPIIHSKCILCVTTNTQGRHGKGLALTGRDYWGAKYGQARGLSGQSYLLVTKNLKKGFYEKETGITYNNYGLKSLSLSQIRENIEKMYSVAVTMPDYYFIVAYIKGRESLNGYSSKEIWDMFTKDVDIPINIVFHDSFKSDLLALNLS